MEVYYYNDELSRLTGSFSVLFSFSYIQYLRVYKSLTAAYTIQELLFSLAHFIVKLVLTLNKRIFALYSCENATKK